MTKKLSSYKQRLTNYCKKLETVLARFKAEKLETLRSSEDDRSPGHERECRRRLQEALGVIEACTSKIEQLCNEYGDVLDERDDPQKGELDDFELYSAQAEAALSTALDYTVILEGRLRAFQPVSSNHPGATIARSDIDTQETHPTTKNIELPTLPVPTFTGNIWDWDNFWVLFTANVHSQPLPPLFKFNYLINALKGEAYNAVKKFQITEENYQKAVDFLKAKYGNPEELVNRLIDRLEKTTSRSPAISDQRVLLEQIQVIVSQLQDKGEPVDGQLLVKQVLSKFSDPLQRRVLEKKYSMEGSFHMNTLLQFLDDIISSEERIASYSPKPASGPPPQIKKDIRHRELSRRIPGNPAVRACMYCRADHKSGACAKYKTPQERAKYLREHKLCFICASPQHLTSQCKGRVCFLCQGRHHTSCCFKTQLPLETSSNKVTNQPTRPPNTLTAEKHKGKPPQSARSVPTTNHQVTQQQETSILHSQYQARPSQETRSEEQDSSEGKSFLPTGELTVLDPTTRRLRKVTVLLDSGAELSFIDNQLAEELQLPTIETTRLRLRTFGSDQVQEYDSRKVALEMWDENGTSYTLKLLTHDILTATLTSPPVIEEDVAFIKALKLPINLVKRQENTKPRILIGCDQMWQLLCKDESHIRLPSGLHLLPTHLGHLLTGKLQDDHKMTRLNENLESREELTGQEWEQSWDPMIQGNVNTTQILPDDIDEKALWDRYWSLEQDGTEEFVQSEKEVQSLIDQKVMEEFLETIEKKDDGYYVRLPWKKIPTTLPDNRAIALRRLMSVWSSLQKDKDLLEKYNNIFQEQLRLNIIEEIDDEQTPVNGIIHYLPHQAVLTPQKSTTKIRIVFDASAHYKDSPSLNDALHRGPVILPKLYGILLRFRMGRVALISDVEKAFLQVRLHHIDRDATRCLWLRDHMSPPSKSNIRIFRFTRVTFGLLSSPFLLAATTQYHLDQYPNDTDIVQEVKRNLYVDNLLLTLNSQKEAVHAYSRTKNIFMDSKMNLREFISNDETVMEEISSNDRSSETDPKVLGIKWHPTDDVLLVVCRMMDTNKVTKRTVASSIASIYDPLGWMLPLVHKAKVFLQSLWRDDYDWDTPLPVEREATWTTLKENMEGFHKELPRFLVTKYAEAHLITFADASAEAMAACTYLYSEASVNLLMAKGKLPSLKSKMTIPKMELSALTLAMRLTNAVISQIKDTISVKSILILTDSEITLSWVKKELKSEAGPFIRNRVFEIRKIVHHLERGGYSVELGHVQSHINPADCATRGVHKTEFENHFWWKGPEFLSKIVETWKSAYSPITIEELHEGEENDSKSKNAVVENVVVSQENVMDIFQSIRLSSLSSITRVVAYVMRFIKKTIARANRKRVSPITLSPIFQRKTEEDSLEIDGTEMKRASQMLAKQHQLAHVTPKIVKSLQHLNLYTDDCGILRCRGRLGNSDLEQATRFPILLLQKTWLSQIIIRDCHGRLHLSTSHTICRVRENYWIPKLRSEVTKVIRSCVRCQKLNNLPYKYPQQSDLPSRRVLRSRPFAHVGLDYFGPLSIKNEDRIDKCYGCIITCLVTRLVHLDIVGDVSTIAFLRMLRRFFSRRGIPQSITSDNSPTFTLGEHILSECLHKVTITREISNLHIKWIYITPYAPWQGGVYERLIQSAKQALHKTLGKTTPSREELATLIIEIEGMLNTRPLVYVESESDSDRALRPIDFLQNEFEIPTILEPEEEDRDDPEYFTPTERVALQTKQQALEALRSSCQLTEKFWHTWQSHYMTSLREKHQREIGKKRGSSSTPKNGQVVLICDALQPRYQWKMGRIVELVKGEEGVAREAVLLLPSHRKIRRPVNLLVPLELGDNGSYPAEAPTTTPISAGKMTEETQKGIENQQIEERPTRYNLRTRKNPRERRGSSSSNPSVKTISLVTSLCMLIGLCSGLNQTNPPINERHIRCIEGGVELTATEQLPYEICSGDHCKHYRQPDIKETVKFPPQIILHKHEVQWKILRNTKVEILETTCPAAPFCKSIDCTFCSTTVFNPECWPVAAIGVTMMVLYFLITGCYVFLYVPLVVGKPLRLLLRCIWNLAYLICKSIRRSPLVSNRRSRDLIELLAITTTIVLLSSITHACQQIDIFSHHNTICNTSENGKTICQVQIAEVLKINPFKRQACFRLVQNATTIYEIRVTWKSLILTCEPETDYFTREVEYRVVDSKRCPHTGSCVGMKCAGINESSKISELELGNRFPGTTYCVESCGGPGCDCFYWSSGCLFYRIFVVPKSDKTYEIFHCNRWKEAAKVELFYTDKTSGEKRTLVAYMRPNVPISWGILTFTLSSITVPPTPLLNTAFITDQSETALWESRWIPTLHCRTLIAASNMECEIKEDCACYPAESKANCKCKNLKIAERFENLRYRLPMVTTAATFRKDHEGRVQATVMTLSTSEIILTVKKDLEAKILVNEAICSVPDTNLIGCYNCIQGAMATISCTASRLVQAEVTCGDSSFTVNCDEKGIESDLQFAFSKARIRVQCVVSCGSTKSTFEIKGVLKFTTSAQAIFNAWIRGHTHNSHDFQWPDVMHIADVLIQWYKTFLLAITCLAGAILCTYILISCCGIRCIRALFRVFWKLISCIFRRSYGCMCVMIKQIRIMHEKLP